MALGVLALLLYLVSLLLALRNVISTSREVPSDWVFFHPGPIGVPLGVAWINLPLLVLSYAIVSGLLVSVMGVALTVLVGGLGLAASAIAIRCRVDASNLM